MVVVADVYGAGFDRGYCMLLSDCYVPLWVCNFCLTVLLSYRFALCDVKRLLRVLLGV